MTARLLPALVFMAAWGCAARSETRFEYARLVMGVEARVVLYAPDEPAAAAAAARAFDRMLELDAVLSDWRDDSELAALVARAGAGPVAAGEDLWRVVQFGQLVAERSGGAFDMTAGALVACWREARRAGRLPEEACLADALRRTGWRRVTLDAAARTIALEPGTALDFGAIGKGYAADEALAVIRAGGIDAALVDLGGDLAVGAAPPGRRGWRVAIATLTPAAPMATIEVVESGVAHSSDAAQALVAGGVRYSHIVDPRTGHALTERRAVTVVAPDAMTADALASAVSVLGPAAGALLADQFPDTRLHVQTRRTEEGERPQRHGDTETH